MSEPIPQKKLDASGKALPDIRCPVCDGKLDAATAAVNSKGERIPNSNRPKPGDLTVCFYCASERFETRLQQFRVGSPAAAEIAAFLVSHWRIRKARAMEIAGGANGNVRAACLDAQSVLDVERIR